MKAWPINPLVLLNFKLEVSEKLSIQSKICDFLSTLLDPKMFVEKLSMTIRVCLEVIVSPITNSELNQLSIKNSVASNPTNNKSKEQTRIVSHSDKH